MAPTRRAARALLAASFAIGIAYGVSTNRTWMTTIDILSILVLGLLVYVWYREDARSRAFQRGRWQNIGVAAVGFVGLPVYLFRTRGTSRGAIALGLGLVFYIGMVVLVVLGGILGMIARVAYLHATGVIT